MVEKSETKQRILEEIDQKIAAVSEDDRGVVIAVTEGSYKNFHLCSVRPGAVRGNHVHDYDELIWIINGEGVCQIEVKDRTTGAAEKILVDGIMKSYRINKGIEHTVSNLGDSEFYLVCFSVGQKDEPRKTPKMEAQKHFPEIMGMNLNYALEVYEWGEWFPMTDDGVTVSGFWDRRKGDEVPEGYETEEGGRFLSRKGAKAQRAGRRETEGRRGGGAEVGTGMAARGEAQLRKAETLKIEDILLRNAMNGASPVSFGVVW